MRFSKGLDFPGLVRGEVVVGFVAELGWEGEESGHVEGTFGEVIGLGMRRCLPTYRFEREKGGVNYTTKYPLNFASWLTLATCSIHGPEFFGTAADPSTTLSVPARDSSSYYILHKSPDPPTIRQPNGKSSRTFLGSWILI